ncbi:hypothetical protein FVP33_02190 [Lacisediminihabitans profunda]|uniref:Uncharacterized protein n=1 Tax=Lacisediminihabitans profunda TaxID=2594790 RepID=A0A5C8UXX1_9MICO|nr:hypothetical protein FVP33_02190 [Lacisediminihabitans profunda]
MLAPTRWLGIVILPFLAAASVILYGFPTSTERLFAWTIVPPLTAMLLGSAYIGGIWFFISVVIERRWHRVANGFPAVIVFATLAGVATLLHWDRFHPGHISFITWVVLYLTTPFLVLAAWIANRWADPRLPESVDVTVPRGLRFTLAAIGVLAIVAGLALFAFPTWFLNAWAWQLTPLTARIVGAILTLPGMVDILFLVDSRWSAFRLIFQAQLLSLTFIVVALFLRRSDLEWSRLAAPAVVGGIILSFGLYLATYVFCERRRG